MRGWVVVEQVSVVIMAVVVIISLISKNYPLAQTMLLIMILGELITIRRQGV